MGTPMDHAEPSFLRALGAGLAGGVAWIAGLILFFGPAQALLSDPGLQSPKFLYVMGELEPLPHVAGAPWVLPVGVLAIGVLYGIVYRVVRRAFGQGSWWGRGLRFGGVAWTLMVPWFEFYLPWNVMREPVPLVLLEMALWFGVLSLVGVAIAGVSEWGLRGEPAGPGGA